MPTFASHRRGAETKDGPVRDRPPDAICGERPVVKRLSAKRLSAGMGSAGAERRAGGEALAARAGVRVEAGTMVRAGVRVESEAMVRAGVQTVAKPGGGSGSGSAGGGCGKRGPGPEASRSRERMEAGGAESGSREQGWGKRKRDRGRSWGPARGRGRGGALNRRWPKTRPNVQFARLICTLRVLLLRIMGIVKKSV